LADISTLVTDIYEVFEKDVHVDPSEAKAFGEELSKVVTDAVTERKGNHLRLSNLGNSCKRQLWYSINTPELAEKLHGSTRIKFLIGHITEAVILFLAKLAGHAVTDQQREVNINGVSGHIDGLVDGELVDVKSASPYSFTKFQGGLSPAQDAFGYLSQLGSYAHALGLKRGHFLPVNKVLGHLHLDTHELPEKDYDAEIDRTRVILSSPTPPERGFTDEPEGASGNRKLGVKCSYCDFKFTCFPGVTQYNYARGPVYLTKVVRPPRVSAE
jgi:hypothetical protein